MSGVSKKGLVRAAGAALCLAALLLSGCIYVWTGAGATNNWSDTANWAVYNPYGGTWDPATAPPDADDDVYYYGASSVKDCVVDFPVDVGSLYTDAGYTGTIDVAADLGTPSLDIQGGTFRVGPGVTVTIENGGTFTAGPSSTVVLAGTGLLPGEWATVIAEPGTNFSMDLAGDVDIRWARISGLDNAGLEISSAAGATVSLQNVLFEDLESPGGWYLNVTGPAWDGYSFVGLAFEEVGAGPNTTGTVRIAVPGIAAVVTLTKYGSSTPQFSSGDGTDVEVGDDQVIWGPLAATLSEPRAVRLGSVVAVEWTALSERGTAGYRLYRAVRGAGRNSPAGPEAGPRAQRRPLDGYGPWEGVTRRPVPARLGRRGTKLYRAFDRRAPRGVDVAYMVEEMGLLGRPGGGVAIARLPAGEGAVAGEALVAAPAPSAAEVVLPARPFRPEMPRFVPSPALKPWGVTDGAPAPPSRLTGVSSWGPDAFSRFARLIAERRLRMIELLTGEEVCASGTVKLRTSGEGIFEIPLAEVDAIDPAARRLSRLGLLRDMRETGGAVRFYAAEHSTRYSGENVLWLGPGAGSSAGELWDLLRSLARTRLFARNGGETPAAHVAVERVERNEFYYGYYPESAAGTDRWYFADMISPGQPIEVDVGLSSPVPEGTARLRAAVLGFSGDPDVAPDHHLIVELNGQPVGEARWDGFALGSVEIEFAASRLLDGANAVTFRLPGDTGAWADLGLLDWVEIEYPRALRAVDGRLRFDVDAPEGTLVSVSGFGSGDVEVVDVTSPRKSFLPPANVEPAGGGWKLSFRTTVSGRRTYFAACAGAFGAAAVSASAAGGVLRERQGEVDYVAVGSAEMLEAAAGLLEKRAGEGLTVLRAELDEVVDEFGGGIYHPDAIRELARYHRPGFLLLLGTGTLDFRNYSGSRPPNVVPNYIASDGVSEAASDNLLGCVEGGDELPEVAVGRLPARNVDELVAMVEKALARAAGGAYALDYESILVADEGEPLFGEVISDVAGLLGDPRREIRVADYDRGDDVRADILDAASRGARTVLFFGHGSNDRWSSLNVLNTADVAGLDCGNGYPISLQFSCLTGDYGSGAASLAVEMMKRSGDGVSAAVASSGFAPSPDQAQLARALAARLAAGGGVKIGPALMEAKRSLGVRRHAVLRTFNLLGDPAME